MWKDVFILPVFYRLHAKGKLRWIKSLRMSQITSLRNWKYHLLGWRRLAEEYLEGVRLKSAVHFRHIRIEKPYEV